MPNAKQRRRYGYTDWCNYLRGSIGKISEYNEDYYKYLRGMHVIRDLENYERAYMDAYDYVVMGVYPFAELQRRGMSTPNIVVLRWLI